ncbi:hypothetical protein I547_3708 [Mycobacterium kansasii 824]|nr:hypothetical protein I547_3708 [Mycobacterium kansasii 824]
MGRWKAVGSSVARAASQVIALSIGVYHAVSMWSTVDDGQR